MDIIRHQQFSASFNFLYLCPIFSSVECFPSILGFYFRAQNCTRSLRFFFRFSFFYIHTYGIWNIWWNYENCSCEQIYSLLFGFFLEMMTWYWAYICNSYIPAITFGEFFIEFFSKSINNCTNWIIIGLLIGGVFKQCMQSLP